MVDDAGRDLIGYGPDPLLAKTGLDKPTGSRRVRQPESSRIVSAHET